MPGGTPGAGEWIEVARYAAAFQTELALRILREAGIPARVRGDPPGVFGALRIAGGPKGYRVLVRAADAAAARELLAEETSSRDSDGDDA